MADSTRSLLLPELAAAQAALIEKVRVGKFVADIANGIATALRPNQL